jgi:hypothetical protein
LEPLKLLVSALDSESRPVDRRLLEPLVICMVELAFVGGKSGAASTARRQSSTELFVVPDLVATQALDASGGTEDD